MKTMKTQKTAVNANRAPASTTMRRPILLLRRSV